MNDDLSMRVQTLEKQLRTKSAAFAGILIIVVTFFGWMMLPSNHITAKRFVTVWPDVIMEERTEGGTIGSVSIKGKNTMMRLSEIIWVKEAPDTSFTSRPRVQLIADDKQTGLLLYDRSGKMRVQLVVSDDEPKLVLLDKTGQAVFSAP